MPDTPLLDTVEHETGASPQWSVLWLHGLGADGHDFAPLVPELVRPDWPALRFVFPHAPVRAVTINNGVRMRAWYDIVGMDFPTRADSAGIEESLAQVDALIAREQARGIAPERLLLAGFSQGGAITLAAGLRRQVDVATGLQRLWNEDTGNAHDVVLCIGDDQARVALPMETVARAPRAGRGG